MIVLLSPQDHSDYVSDSDFDSSLLYCCFFFFFFFFFFYFYFYFYFFFFILPSIRYWTVRGHVPVSIHPLSIITRFGSTPEWLLFHDVTHTDQNIHVREVSKIEPRWLVELAEHYYDVSKIRK